MNQCDSCRCFSQWGLTLPTPALSATDIAWSVASGPLSGIDAAGLATATTVYEDTAATAVSGTQKFHFSKPGFSRVALRSKPLL